MDSVAAKEFLISRVVQQAGLERAMLSEVERKMLYFTEVHPSLPDIHEVNAEFERDYDADEYEAKIAGLLRNARNRDRNESAAKEQEWEEALDALKKEDHYLLVMVRQAFSGASPTTGSRLRDFAIYSAVGIGLVLILYLASIWKSGH
jgi:hypothetical protein